MTNPQLLRDQIDVELSNGDEVTVWNSLTVTEQHNVGVNSIESHHSVLVGDGSTGEKPEFVTPEMDQKLARLNVYPNVRIIDPTDEEVTIL